MILYFADRQMNIIGHASTTLPGGRVIREDLKSEEVETGVATFSCFIGYTDETRAEVEAMASAGNYLLRSQDNENEFYTIIDSEIDTKNRDVYIYAEDAGLDLINEIVGEFEADDSHDAEWYVNKYIADSGFEIGINEIPKDKKLKLSWEGEATVTERLASVATQFGGFEVSYSYEIKGLEITKKYINIFEKRGKDEGVQLRLNRDIDRIVTSKSVANLATAFLCEGGVPDDAETPITFSSKNYSYDDGDFFVDGDKLKSRKANEKWSRYVWNKEPNKVGDDGGYIVRPYSYNTTDPETLKSHAIAELKKVCDMEINYEIDINRLPDGVKIGDRVNIVDDAGELYVSTRVLLLETSVCDRKYKATLGEHIIKKSGISQKVVELATEFAQTAQSALKAYEIAKEALKDAQEAHGAVGEIGKTITKIDETVKNANSAASEAKSASAEAKGLAQNASDKAVVAHEYYEAVKKEYPGVKEAAEKAAKSAEDAQKEAKDAADFAEQAKDFADAAKLDAEQAKKDIEDFGNKLETTVETLTAEYARKTDLTETTATLSSEIRKSAALISSVVSGRTVIDATANDAQDLVAKAKAKAEKAQELSDAADAAKNQAIQAYKKLQADADAAQAAADAANDDVTEAQELLDTARANLDEAEANLKAVLERADATSDEIDAAASLVAEAEIALENAKAQVDAMKTQANEARNAAGAAHIAAEKAKGEADAATDYASYASTMANEFNVAYIAQDTANQAAEVLAEANNDLSQARAQLEAILEDATSTEEAIAEARAAVEAAQAVVDQAKADAAEASTEAKLANELADLAKADAEEARKAANKAQQMADDAYEMADDAKDAADTLGLTLVGINTWIEQTDEKIVLTATKEEVKAIQVGGKNLLRGSGSGKGWTYYDAFDVRTREFQRSTTETSEVFIYCENTFDLTAGEEYTLSFEAKENGNISGDMDVYILPKTWSTTGIALSKTIRDLETEYQKYVFTFTPNADATSLEECTLRFDNNGSVASGTSAVLYIRDIKLEKGNKATDWTYAPEDLLEDIVQAQEDAQEAIESITRAEAEISILADSISNLVRSNSEGTLVKQDANGLWYFDISNIEKNISDTAGDLSNLEGIVLDSNGKIDVLQSTAAALQQRTEYVRSYTDENDQPCIELGEGDSSFKVRITNTEIQFEEDGAVPAKINRKMLIIEKTIVKNELQFGDDTEVEGVWIWKRRNNGNLGLSWKGGNN